LIVTGISTGSDGLPKMSIAKIQTSDGETVWTMSHTAGSGAETVAFTSDGGFIIGGYIDSDEQAE
jgi:hypothetical protein